MPHSCSNRINPSAKIKPRAVAAASASQVDSALLVCREPRAGATAPHQVITTQCWALVPTPHVPSIPPDYQLSSVLYIAGAGLLGASPQEYKPLVGHLEQVSQHLCAQL